MTSQTAATSKPNLCPPLTRLLLFHLLCPSVFLFYVHELCTLSFIIIYYLVCQFWLVFNQPLILSQLGPMFSFCIVKYSFSPGLVFVEFSVYSRFSSRIHLQCCLSLSFSPGFTRGKVIVLAQLCSWFKTLKIHKKNGIKCTDDTISKTSCQAKPYQMQHTVPFSYPRFESVFAEAVNVRHCCGHSSLAAAIRNVFYIHTSRSFV